MPRRTPIHIRNAAAGPVDAVITWVDGTAESHRRSRARFIAEARLPLHGNAVNPHRWNSSDEILYCLTSIETYAPWVRTIWIVVDHDAPDISTLSGPLRAKIRIAYHHEIFGEYSAALPTFNSLAIESVLWRIEGLAECFMYFNDDVFLTAPLSPADVFRGGAPVLRGAWVDYSGLLKRPKSARKPKKFHHFMQINAARIAGFDARRLFRAAHVVHPLRKSVMAALFDAHRDHFIRNTGFRFRDLSQFLPQGLHNHACIATRNAVIHTKSDHLHIKSGQGKGKSSAKTRTLLQDVARSDIKFLCVNDLPQLEAAIPDVRDWLGSIVGARAREAGAP